MIGSSIGCYWFWYNGRIHTTVKGDSTLFSFLQRKQILLRRAALLLQVEILKVLVASTDHGASISSACIGCLCRHACIGGDALLLLEHPIIGRTILVIEPSTPLLQFLLATHLKKDIIHATTMDLENVCILLIRYHRCPIIPKHFALVRLFLKVIINNCFSSLLYNQFPLPSKMKSIPHVEKETHASYPKHRVMENIEKQLELAYGPKDTW